MADCFAISRLKYAVKIVGKIIILITRRIFKFNLRKSFFCNDLTEVQHACINIFLLKVVGQSYII